MSDPQHQQQDAETLAARAPDSLPEQREAIQRERQESGVPLSLEAREHQTNVEVIEHDIEGVGEHLAGEVEQLRNIDLGKNIQEQQDQIELLEAVANRLIGKLESHKIDTSNITLLPEPNTTQIAEWNLNSVEVSALAKLREIAQHPGSVLYLAWSPEWTQIRSVALQDLEVAEQLKSGKKTEKTKKVWERIKEKPVQSALLVTAGVVGAWMVWRMVKGIATKKEETKAHEVIGTAAIATGIGASLFMLGGILDIGGWRQWIRENIHINITPRNLWRYITSGFKLEALREGMVEISDLDRKVAKYIKGSAEEVAMLKLMDFEEFTSAKKEIGDVVKGKLPSIARELGVPEIALTGMLDDEEALDTAQKLRTLFKSKEATLILKDKKPKTVARALDLLEAENFFDSRETEQSEDTSPEDAEGEPEEERSWIWNGVAAERLLSAVGENSATAEILTDQEHSWWHPAEFLRDLIPAVLEDGHALVSVDGVIGIVVEGYKWVTISSIESLGHAFEFIWSEDETLKDAAQGYLHDTLGFVMVIAGARVALTGIKALLGKASFGSMIGEALRGAGEGLLMPATVVRTHRLAGEWITRNGKEAIYSIDELLRTSNPETGRAIHLRRLRHYVELFEYYDEAAKAIEGEGYGKWKSTAKTWRSKADIERLRDKYASRIARHQSEFVKFMKEKFSTEYLSGESLPKVATEETSGAKGAIDEIRTTSHRLIEYMQQIEDAEATRQATELKKARTQPNGWEEYHNEAFDRFLRRHGIEPRTPGARAFIEGYQNRLLMEYGLTPGTPEAEALLETQEKAMGKKIAKRGRIQPNIDLDAEAFRRTITDRVIREEIARGIPEETAKLRGKEAAEQARLKPRVEHVPGKAGTTFEVYRYMETEFKIPQSEVSTFPDRTTNPSAHYEAARQYCSKKWRIPALEHVKIEMVEPSAPGGTPTYRINGEVIHNAPDMENAKVRYLDALEEGGKQATPEFLEVINNANHPLWRWIGPAERILGTAGTVALLYMLVSEEDKKKAVIEVSAILGTALGGAQLFEKTLGRLSKNRAFHFFGNLTFGLLAYFNLGDETEVIIEFILEKLHLDNAETTEIVAEMMELQMTLRYVLPTAMHGIERVAMRQGAGKLSRALIEKRVASQWLRKIGKIAGSKIVKKILMRLGWRGAVAGVLFLDDASGIGVADDVIAIGLIGWTAVDIVKLTGAVSKAIKFDREEKKRDGKTVSRVELPPEKETLLVQKLEEAGFTRSQIYKDNAIDETILANFTENEIISLIGDGEVALRYTDVEGKEVITLRGGEVVKVAYYGADGKLIAEMAQEQVEETEQLMAEAEERAKEKSEEGEEESEES